MKLRFTEQALKSFQECLDFLSPEVPADKIIEIRDRILAKTGQLAVNPGLGQPEELLASLGLSHRRLIEGNYKIIYRVMDDTVIITDIFDSRQDPGKMLRP